VTDLGLLGAPSSPGAASYAYAINDSGAVVGTATAKAYEPPHPFLFINGKMTDLNSQIPANSGWVLREVWGINNKGQIVGMGTDAHGNSQGFLLTPAAETPEPTSLVLLSLGGLGLAGHAWRKRRRAAA
jgi:probable HAF family extracellular repeat protein